MSYETTINGVRDAALSYTPNVPEISEAYAAAMDQPKVQLIVAVFRALAPVANDLDNEGRTLLCGAAHLLNAHNFSRLRPEGLAILQTIPQTLTQTPA